MDDGGGAILFRQPLATQAGLEILKRGGNAAAVHGHAVQRAHHSPSMSTEPMSTGLGGDCFALYYSSKDGTVQGLNGSGRSPAALTLEKAMEGLPPGATELPHTSAHSVTVPGAAAGWEDTIAWFGSGKLSMKEILAPAIALAEEGQVAGSGQTTWLILAPDSPEYLHAIIEACRLAFADSRWFATDQEHYKTPVREMLSKDYLDQRASLVDPHRAHVHPLHGTPAKRSDTVYLSVVDGEGNACSFINSVYDPFGGIVPKGCGFALQCRGANFSLDPACPNCLAPAKRPYHTIIPAMAIRKDVEEVICFGVMGGFMQASVPQGHLQVLLHLLHRGWTPQRVLDYPRVCLDPHTGDVDVEVGIGAATIDALRQRGHTIQLVVGHARKLFGRGQIIITRRDARTGKRVLIGGSDMRGDGQVAGW
ncbi:nucleophile aminohydrolase [Syncephalis pseudoplumigaleata]|uniref:Nucleophile aminohydrolase n=1 Tax=Syncephalis pseudoplumigaleata TaxID=1712513 RepID=A0A4P9YXP2_9FUNG|nr:nucleophile aminohydrolase [Syncephalis pseudoplumigaleata]|eukprot:RKP24665.1 nucleophile aminohydrolase [Syncephalis pseudoplumigaleata]